MNKKNIIKKNNLLIENRLLMEKFGSETVINDLTNKIESLTNRVNNGEEVETELKDVINKLTIVLQDNTISEAEINENISSTIRNTLLAAFIALGMTNTQAQERVNNITSTNLSAETVLNSETKTKIDNVINNYFKSNNIKQVIIGISGKASQVTAPNGMTNEDLANKRAQEAKKYIESKYGDRVIINEITTSMGNTKYIKGVDKPSDDKFTQEQGVDIILKAVLGSYLFGEFNNITVKTGDNPDNLCIYDNKNNLIHSTGFFGSGEKYHPHYILSTTTAIYKQSELSKFNEKFTGSFEELKSMLTSPKNDRDIYYKNALNKLEQLYNSNKPIYLYKLSNQEKVDLSGKGFVKIKVVVNDKDTNGSVSIVDKSGKLINSEYDNTGFTTNVIAY